jgi:hypothetical protein
MKKDKNKKNGLSSCLIKLNKLKILMWKMSKKSKKIRNKIKKSKIKV